MNDTNNKRKKSTATADNTTQEVIYERPRKAKKYGDIEYSPEDMLNIAKGFAKKKTEELAKMSGDDIKKYFTNLRITQDVKNIATKKEYYLTRKAKTKKITLTIEHSHFEQAKELMDIIFPNEFRSADNPNYNEATKDFKYNMNESIEYFYNALTILTNIAYEKQYSKKSDKLDKEMIKTALGKIIKGATTASTNNNGG